jgi:CheY-like chemotaxis protein
LAASFLPDLIVLDEMMPIMSGLEMVHRLKQNPRLAHIPLVLLTAKSDNDTENESIKLGVDAFMAKPFERILTTACSNSSVPAMFWRDLYVSKLSQRRNPSKPSR